MCTLVVARKLFRSHPIVIAANRDEFLDRPAAPPQVWKGNPAILAPVDKKAGGTWIGVSDRGVIAAITNRHDVPTLTDKESRGTLVLAALEAPDARMATSVISKLSGTMFNGFNLVVLDRSESYLLKGDGCSIDCRPLKDGLHVITQFGTDPSHCKRAKDVALSFGNYGVIGPRPLPLNQMLSIHENGSLNASCVHMPDKGYGTRSSTIIRVATDGLGADYWHREGPACGSRFGTPTRFDFKK